MGLTQSSKTTSSSWNISFVPTENQRGLIKLHHLSIAIGMADSQVASTKRLDIFFVVVAAVYYKKMFLFVCSVLIRLTS